MSATKSIPEIFASMMQTAEVRRRKFAEALESAPQSGPCAACGRREVGLDEAATLQEAEELNYFRPIYDVCEPCSREAAILERLARMGVPARVRHATFENFDTPETRMAEGRDAVQAWLHDDSKPFLLLLGGYGTGKGHLAAAAIRASGLTASWTRHADLVNDYHGVDFARRPQFIRRFRGVPLLVIDEMGAKNPTADTEELFYGILDLRYDLSLKTILIGNIPLKAKPRTNGTQGLDILSLIGRERMESRLADSAVTVTSKAWADWRKKR